MTHRLPIPGQDDGTWGTILNDYLQVTHASDGTLNGGSVGASQLQDGAVTNSKLDVTLQSSIAKADSAVQTVNGQPGPAVHLTSVDVSAIPAAQFGAANGVATLNGSSQLTSSQLPAGLVSVSGGRPNQGVLAQSQFLSVYGHSVARGVGARQVRAGYTAKLARMLGAQDMINWAVGGAIACHGNVGGQGDGGWATVLSATAARATGGSGTGGGGGQGNFGYVPLENLVLIQYGENDIPTLGSNNPTPLVEAQRTIISWALRANHWPSTAGAPWSTSGSGWTTNPSGYGRISSGHLKVSSTVGDSATFTMPSDWETGKTLAIVLSVNNADNYTLTITKNGTTIKTVTVAGSTIADPNPASSANTAYNGYTIRLQAPGDGISLNPGDTVRLSIASLSAGAVRVDSAHIEASPTEGPVVAVVLPHTLANLTGSSLYASYQFGPTAGTNPLTNSGILSVSTAIVTMITASFGPNVVIVDPEGVYGYNGGAGSGTVTFGASTPSLFTDSVHPNDHGTLALSALVAATLQQSGQLSLLQRSAWSGVPVLDWINIGGAIAAYGTDVNSYIPAFAANCSAGDIPPAYRVDLKGVVRFMGQVNCSSFGSYPTTLITGLVVGLRPSQTKYYLCPCATNTAPATISIDSSGTVKCVAGGDPTGIYLDAISYSADD